MSTRQSVCAALVVALGFSITTVSCGGDDASTGPKPVQDLTFLTVQGNGDTSTAFGWNKDSGWSLAQVKATDKLTMAFTGSATNGSGSFSGALAGGGTFSAAASGTASFSATITGSGSFSGSAIINASCSVDDLCQFAQFICDAFSNANGADGADASCGSFSIAQCDAEVSGGNFQQTLLSAVGGDEAEAAVVCAVIDFFGCIARAAGTAEQLASLTDAQAQACADSSGITALAGAFAGQDNSNSN